MMSLGDATTSASGTGNQLQDTITAGLSNWSNPLAAAQMLPGAVQLLTVPGYRSYAAGVLLPVAAIVLLLVTAGSSRGRK